MNEFLLGSFEPMTYYTINMVHNYTHMLLLTEQHSPGIQIYKHSTASSIHLVDTRDDLPPDNLLVLLPILTVLLGALLVISQITVDQENGKVQDVEVGEHDTPSPGLALDNLTTVKHGDGTRGAAASAQNLITSNAGGKRVRPALQPIAEIVDMASDAPPSGGDETGASLGLEVGKMLDAGVLGVRAEVVLLAVGQTEDAITSSQNSADSDQAQSAELLGVGSQVTGLGRVHEGHPNNVSETQHESKAIGGDVHRRQNGRLHVDTVEDVEGLDGGDEEDRIGDIAELTVLFGDVSAVEDDPSQKAGTHLHELLDVHLADEGQGDARVELATNVEIVDERASDPAGCELAHVLVAGLDVEAAHVDKDGEGGGDEDVGADDLGKVVGDESPDWELSALGNGAGSQDGQGAHGRVESVQLVLEFAAGAQFGSLNVVAGENTVLDQR